MRIIVPLPIERDELDQLEERLQAEYGLSFDELMRAALTSWSFMGDLDPPDVNDVALVSVSREDFYEWYEAAQRLSNITHRLGRSLYEQLAPCLQKTFGTDNVDMRLIKTIPNGLLLELKESFDG